MNTKRLKHFDLESAKAGAKVVTQDGLPVRIVCFDFRKSEDESNPRKMIGLVEREDDAEEPLSFSLDGKVDAYLNPYAKDLFMAPTKHEGWVNIYRNGGGVLAGKTVYITQEKAKIMGRINDAYIATTQVEWEE